MKAFVKPYVPGPGEHERFARQARDFGLKWLCPDCVHVRASTCTCSLEFRTRDLMEATSFVEARGNFTFCKYFEAS